jgi:flagellar biosynthesis/type III secretory pathway chaperone
MGSTGAEIGAVSHRRFADLEAVLTPLVPALEQLQRAQIEQRRVVVLGDLSAMLKVNMTIEETSARIALLEQRRQNIQAELEGELGVEGLRAVLKTATIAPADRARIGQLLVQVTRLVRDLREQGQKNASLLDAAIGAARRTRQVLERLSGADNTYDPVKARRQHAAMRARAALTQFTPRNEGTPPAQAGLVPALAGEDVASSLGREAP